MALIHIKVAAVLPSTAFASPVQMLTSEKNKYYDNSCNLTEP